MKANGLEQKLGIKNCTKCILSKNRKNIVVGEGKKDSEVLILGEAPGREEDEKARPFVGRAGETLDSLLNHIGLGRKETYITNVVKCKPPSNRDPKKEEMDSCEPYLLKQIKTVDPSVIVSLGRVATKRLVEEDFSLRNKHGTITQTVQKYQKRKLFITYHPAACLYNKGLEETLKEDFEKLSSFLKILNQN